MSFSDWLWYLTLLFMVIIAFPGLAIIHTLLGPLDRYPYIQCAGLGLFLALAAWVVTFQSRATGRCWIWVLILCTCLLPFLLIFIGITANALFDCSPPVEHETDVIRYELRTKGPGVCIVQSWRHGGHEILYSSNLVQKLPLLKCKPGSRLKVTTRTGVFGWEWVVKVE